MKTKWLLGSIIVGAAVVFLAIKLKRPLQPQSFGIAVISIVEIEPIAELRKGFRQGIEESQFAKDHKVVFTEYNAQGDSGVVNQIADKIAAERPDLVYALGTPVAQAVQKRAPELLIVQGAVTDPVAAGLAKSWEGSGKKYIATSDLPPVDKQVRLIRELTPKVSRLGIMYNPGEANSVAVVSRLREYIPQAKLNIKLVERSVANSSDVATAMQSLLGNVDAIYLPPDNTVHAAIPVVGKFAKENKVPFYATVKNALDEGALATLSLDFVQLGKESAALTLAVLAGQDPATIPIRLNENPSVFISAKAAANLGVDIEQFRTRPNVKIIE
jgi:putative tryptophan/tyrosine transport system substrate-binding protein